MVSDDFTIMYGDLATPATRYDNDAVSHPTAIKVVITNARNLLVVGARGDRLLGRVPSRTTIVAGQVLQVPSFVSGWYVVGTVLQRSVSRDLDAGTAFSLLALPEVLTVDRIATPPALSSLTIYDEPATVDSGGHPVIATEAQITVRAGFSNSYDPLNDQKEGPLPLGLTTAYVPLGSGVTKDDTLILPDGTPAMVQQTNLLYADGTAYATQLILATTVGAGLVGG